MTEPAVVAVAGEGSTFVLAGESLCIGNVEPDGGLSCEAWIACTRDVGMPTCIALTDDASLAAVGTWNGVIEIYALNNGKVTHRIVANRERGVESVALSPDGTTLYSVGGDGVLRVWETASGALVNEIAGSCGQVITSVGVSPDGEEIACTAWDGRVVVFASALARSVRRFPQDEHAATGPSYSQDGQLIATAGWLDGPVRIWDAHSGEAVTVLSDRMSEAKVRFVGNGTHVIAVEDNGAVNVWNRSNWQRDAQYHLPKGTVTSAVVSSTGRYIATCHRNDAALIWRWEDGQVVCAVSTDHSGGIVGVAFLPSDELVAVLANCEGATIYNLESRTALSRIEPFCLESDDIQVSSRGDMVITGSVGRNVLEVWDVRNPVEPVRRIMRESRDEAGVFGQVSFSADGRYCAYSVGPLGGKGGIKIVRSHDWKRVVSIPTDNHPLNGLAFSPDDHFLASSGVDGVVSIWSTEESTWRNR